MKKTKKSIKYLKGFLLVFLMSYALFWRWGIGPAYANNITVSNGIAGSQDAALHTLKIQFNIAWENSWRDATNYDAARIFIKYSTDGVTWSAATLRTAGLTPADVSVGTGTPIQILIPSDKKGAFIQWSVTGSGNLSATGVQLTWDYTTGDGLNDAQASSAVIKVMAIEMVYIPTAAFYIGDGNGTSQSTDAFYQTANTAVQITTDLKQNIRATNTSTYASDAQLVSPGIGIDGDGGLATTNGAVDNANFPTGYNAFYLMKYEISQGQYRDFLNTLTRAQQNNRTASQAASYYVMSGTTGVSYRNGIRAPATIPGGAITFGCDLNANGTFNEAADGEWIACNYLSWADVVAYADWAGLRPMTELEFEKAARGTNAAVYQEGSWGGDITTTAVQATGISNSGQTNEIPSNAANCVYGSAASVQGPLRVGALATAATTRISSGSGYYGNMELSGSLWERPVTVGNATGRAFTGLHGDGALDASGNANVSLWPAGADAIGAGFRGGGWTYGATHARVSDRSYAASTAPGRDYYVGGRCVRTSP